MSRYSDDNFADVEQLLGEWSTEISVPSGLRESVLRPARLRRDALPETSMWQMACALCLGLLLIGNLITSVPQPCSNSGLHPVVSGESPVVSLRALLPEMSEQQLRQQAIVHLSASRLPSLPYVSKSLSQTQ